MDIHESPRHNAQSDLFKHLVIVGGVVAGACLLGVGVASASGGENAQLLAVAAAVMLILGAAIAYALEIPLIGIVRSAYIASFFVKCDISLFKVNETEDPSGLNLSATLFIALILLAYDHFDDDERSRVFSPTFSFLSIGLVMWAAASVFYAGPVALGMFSLGSLLTSVIIAYATASHFGRPDRIVHLIVGVGAGLLFTGLVALSQFVISWPLNLPFLGTGTEEEQAGTQSQLLARVPAFLRTPTGMAWVVSTLVPIVIAPVICRVKSFTSQQRLLLAAAGFAGIVAVILSLARGSWIGLVAALVLMIAAGWYRLSTHERKSYFVTISATLALTCVLLIPFSGRIYDRLTGDDEGAAGIRIPLMQNAIKMIEAHPIVGVGLNGYRASMTKHDDTGVFVSRAFPNPVHNVFAHITTEIGIPGGIIFCLLILVSFWESFKAMGVNDRLLFALGLGAAVGLVAFCISGMKEPGSLGSVRAPIRNCFLLFGIVMAIGRIRRSISA
jgi:O-antigen ligase